MRFQQLISSSIKIIRVTNSLTSSFRSYLASLSLNEDIKYIAKKRYLQYLWNPARVVQDPAEFKSTAVLFGSGESINKYHSYFLQSDSHSETALKRVFNSSYIVHLNTTVFSGIPCHLALFEVPANRYMRGVFNELFEEGCHSESLGPDSALVFTHCNLDKLDDYIRSDVSPNTCLLPQMYIFPPTYEGRYGLVIFKLIFIFHSFVSKVGLLPRALWYRGSSVRAVWLLALAGYKVIYMVGFDGSTNYFYSDASKWPRLGRLRAMREFYSATQIEIMAGGRKAFKKGFGDSTLHPSLNPDLSKYTCPTIVELIAKVFKIKLIYL
jgi:hypothetical protein